MARRTNDSALRGDDGVLRGDDGVLRGDDGVLRGDDGVLRGAVSGSHLTPGTGVTREASSSPMQPSRGEQTARFRAQRRLRRGSAEVSRESVEVSREPSPARELPASRERAESPTLAPRAASILVVESDPDLQNDLARMVSARGHHVIGTGSAVGARALLDVWSVDLILVAEDLPGCDGVALAKALTRDARCAVVLMGTSQAAPPFALDGVTHFLAKPFDLARMGTLIDALVSPAELTTHADRTPRAPIHLACVGTRRDVRGRRFAS